MEGLPRDPEAVAPPLLAIVQPQARVTAPAQREVGRRDERRRSTYRLVLRRLKGDATPLTPAEDWPAVPAPTGANWRAAVAALEVPAPPYTAYTQFIGMTQHDLYHAGQMALLKKALHP